MAVSRASAGLGRTVLSRAATQSRTQAWRQTARRYASTGTASAHRAKKTSDIPWLIGSVAFTVPAAVWLMGQGPQKSDHHGGHESHKEEAEDQPAEEQPEEKSEDTESKEGEKESEEEDEKAKGDDEESKGDEKSEESSSDDSDDGDKKDTPDTSDNEDGYEKPGPNAPGQINYKSSMDKGPGEGQKGPRKPSEKKGEKDSAKDKSGAQNPYLDDDEKSKKGEGLKETQKIHGTVDPSRPAR